MTASPYQERWQAALMNNYGTPRSRWSAAAAPRCGTRTAAATWTWSPASR